MDPSRKLEIQWRCHPVPQSKEHVLAIFQQSANPFFEPLLSTEKARVFHSVSHSQGPLHVIQKQHAEAGKVDLLSSYYVLKSDVYQCPDIVTVASSRMVCDEFYQ